MNNPIKKIIAREGLIILGVIVASVFILLVGNFAYNKCYYFAPEANRAIAISRFGIDVKTFGAYVLLLGYPVSWLIRFILWAIRILKEK